MIACFMEDHIEHTPYSLLYEAVFEVKEAGFFEMPYK